MCACRVKTDISPHANGKSGVVSRSPNAFATADLAMEMRPPLPRPFSASELQQHPARSSSLLHHQIAALQAGHKHISSQQPVSISSQNSSRQGLTRCVIARQEEVAQLEADLHRLLPASGSAGRISSCQSEPPMTSPQGTVDLSERQLNEAKQDRNGRKAGRMAREVTRSMDLTVDLVLVDGTPVLADGIGRPRSASATEALPSAPSAENSDVARRTLMCLENIMAKPGAPLRAIQRAAGFTEMRKLINSHVPNLDATELRRLFDECDTDQVIKQNLTSLQVCEAIVLNYNQLLRNGHKCPGTGEDAESKLIIFSIEFVLAGWQGFCRGVCSGSAQAD